MSQDQPISGNQVTSRRQISIPFGQITRSQAVNVIGLPELIGLLGAAFLAVTVVFVGMSVVALMALPVGKGIPVAGDQASGYGTELGGHYVESPVLGVVQALTSGFAGDLLQYAVAIIAMLVLSQAANAGMVGIARTTYTLATHRQLPRGVARLHPRYGTPWMVAVPLVWAVVQSFRSDDEILHSPLRLPGTWHVGAFTRAWTKGHIGSYMLNTLLVLVFSVTLTMLFGSMVAYVSFGSSHSPPTKWP